MHKLAVWMTSKLNSKNKEEYSKYLKKLEDELKLELAKGYSYAFLDYWMMGLFLCIPIAAVILITYYIYIYYNPGYIGIILISMVMPAIISYFRCKYYE